MSRRFPNLPKLAWPKLPGRKKQTRSVFATPEKDKKRPKANAARPSVSAPNSKGLSWGDRIAQLFGWFALYPQTTGHCLMVLSLFVCMLLSLTRWPGMEIAGVGPHWLLIWVVAWSLKRSPQAGALAGLLLGMLQDGMTAQNPTHMLSLAIVGWLTAKLQKQRFLNEDFISAAFVVFGMSVLAETVMAVQFSLMELQRPLIHEGAAWMQYGPAIARIWQSHQSVALSTAILSSLWAPILYLPLSRLWRFMDAAQQKRFLEMSFRSSRR
jgi:rod shape-determining protein MreD